MTWLAGLLVVFVGAVIVLMTSPPSGAQSAPAYHAGSFPAIAPATSAHVKFKGSPVVIFEGRDPFVPLVFPGQTVSPSPSESVPGDGSVPSVSPAGTTSATPAGGSSAEVGGYTVSLIDVFEVAGKQKAQVEVDGQVYTVTEGNTFAGNFKFVSADGACANFLYADQSFELCDSSPSGS